MNVKQYLPKFTVRKIMYWTFLASLITVVIFNLRINFHAGRYPTGPDGRSEFNIDFNVHTDGVPTLTSARPLIGIRWTTAADYRDPPKPPRLILAPLENKDN